MDTLNPTLALPIRLVLVDDHAIVREGLAALLEGNQQVVVVGQAENGQQALHLVAELKPDVVLMDIAMPVLDGLAATQRLSQHYPQVRVLILSMHNEAEYVQTILQAGARGYITKDTASESELIRAISTVFQGALYVGANASQQLFSQSPKGVDSATPVLSAREIEVLKLIVQGAANKTIARQLDNISDRTVEAHRYNIHRKLGTRTTAELVKYALEHRLV